MKKNHLVLLAIFIITLTIFSNFSNLLAAEKVRIILKQPPPNQLATKDLWRMTLENMTNERVEIFLKGSATEETDGLIATAQTVTIILKAKEIKNMKVSDLPKTPDIDYVAKDGRYKESLIRQGKFPEGNYEICVKVIGAGTNEEMGSDCFTQSVKESGGITLISPSDGEEIMPGVNPVFTWTGKPGETYELKIVEVKEGQSPEEAVEKNQAFFVKKDIKSTTFTYPVAGEKFEEGKKYMWVIKNGLISSELYRLLFKGNSTVNGNTPTGIPILKYKLIYNKEKRLWESNYKNEDLDRLLKEKKGNSELSKDVIEKLKINILDNYYKNNNEISDSVVFLGYSKETKSKNLNSEQIFPVVLNNSNHIELTLINGKNENRLDNLSQLDSVIVRVIAINNNFVTLNTVYGMGLLENNTSQIFPGSITSLSWGRFGERRHKIPKPKGPVPRIMATAWIDNNMNKVIDQNGYFPHNYTYEFFETDDPYYIYQYLASNGVERIPQIKIAWGFNQDYLGTDLSEFVNSNIKVQIEKVSYFCCADPYINNGVIVYPPPPPPPFSNPNNIWEINGQIFTNTMKNQIVGTNTNFTGFPGYASKTISDLMIKTQFNNWRGTYWCRMILKDRNTFGPIDYVYPISNTFQISLY